MEQYLQLIDHILKYGDDKDDRTHTGTISIFGYQMRFSLDKFPLLTTKKLHIKSIIYELLWFIRGDSNIKYLNDHGVSIWDEWADINGDLGPIYGAQWRAWPGPNGNIDQLALVINDIKEQPHSRRLIINSWNVGLISKMALPPCHCLVQFYVAKGKLSCHLYQRSGDVFLGVPFNIASYALLTKMIAQVCDLKPGEFIHTLGDAHLYKNHLAQARMQLERKPLPLPTLTLDKHIKDINDFTYEHISIDNYQYHPSIKAPIAV